uniref:Uncharacterized protein n=1 Tax=Hordeum vulgare subsp. vulgare TaxID=112509 RepID=M0W8Y0_HORVV
MTGWMRVSIQQAQIKACRVCCCSIEGRNCYNRCRIDGDSRETCAGTCACKFLDKCISPCHRFNLYTDAGKLLIFLLYFPFLFVVYVR